MQTVVPTEKRHLDQRFHTPVVWLAWIVWSSFLGGSLAVMVNTIVFGRLPLATIILGWLRSATLNSVFILTVVWWVLYARRVQGQVSGYHLRSMLLPGIPLLATTAAPLSAIYASDVANHYFYYSMVQLNQPKTLAILLLVLVATVLLQAICLEAGKGLPLARAVPTVITRRVDFLIILLLAGIGALQGNAYLPPPGQDFLRYWIIADAIMTGSPYPAIVNSESANVVAGMSSYIIDLPLYPALMAMAFSIFGHNVAAAYIPVAMSNLALPPLVFLLARELMASRILAVSAAALVSLFPLLRFYALNWLVPDALFVAVLILCAWLFVKVVKCKDGMAPRAWFGLSAAASALARPEGIAYAALYWMGILTAREPWRKKALPTLVFLVPVGAFSIIMMVSFGLPWPRNWVSTIGFGNVVSNLPVLVTDEFLTSAIRLSSLHLALGWSLLLGLALVGSAPWLYRPRRISLLLAPAWVNLVSVYMVDPRVSGSRLWFDFFRHVSYVLPLFLLVALATLVYAVSLIRARTPRVLAVIALNIVVIAMVLWSINGLSKPSWNFGPDAVNLLSQERLNLVDFIDHPFELPRLSFERVEGHSVPVFPPDFISSYPDQILAFYRSFDAVKLMTGTAYQTGSMLLYLAAMFLAVLAGLLGRSTDRVAGAGLAASNFEQI